MIREILTLKINNKPYQYYISFGKDRKKFVFTPTLQNKNAPAFEIVVEEKLLMVTQKIDSLLEDQAKEKVKEILNSKIFDQLK